MSIMLDQTVSVVLISVNRTHPDYTSFRPEKHKPASAVEGSEVTSSHQARTQLDIVEIYKSTTHLNPILWAYLFTKVSSELSIELICPFFGWQSVNIWK
ncbi:hypothetical protein EJ110_NYTH22632 [Nymphaea thermarum]|nr:hypothetical protein EJ110_NYTH22632 [Nymphaea thermarum]